MGFEAGRGAEMERGSVRGGPEAGAGAGMIGEDSAGFVESFTAAVRPHEVRGRPLRWMLLVAFAVAFAAALGSLLNGAFGKGDGVGGGAAGNGTSAQGVTASGTASGSALEPLRTGSAASARFTAVAGPECTGGAAAFTESGFSSGTSDPSAGWATSASGGFTGDGCSGAYVSMPVSGNARAVDPDRYALWTFPLASGRAKASCTLAVYVPSSDSPGLVGGAPAYYYYYDSVYTSQGSAKPSGDFAVSQPADRGGWVTVGTLTVSTGVVSVRLVDAGTDKGAGAAGVVRDAAAQVRLACSASAS
jgi:hypothetical protein